MIVRINALGSPHFEGDLMAFACPQVALLNLPKAQSAADVRAAAAALESAERRNGVTRPIGLLVNIETARAMRLAAEIAGAHPRVAGLQLGLADLFESMHADRRDPAQRARRDVPDEHGLRRKRQVSLTTAPIPDVADEEGFRREAEQARTARLRRQELRASQAGRARRTKCSAPRRSTSTPPGASSRPRRTQRSQAAARFCSMAG